MIEMIITIIAVTSLSLFCVRLLTRIKEMEGMIQAFDSSLYELKTISAKTKETDVLIDPVSWLDHLDGKIKDLETKLDNQMDKFKELERLTLSIDSGLHNFEGKVRDHLAGIPENFAGSYSPAPIECLDDEDEEDTKDNEIFQERENCSPPSMGFNTWKYQG